MARMKALQHLQSWLILDFNMPNMSWNCCCCCCTITISCCCIMFCCCCCCFWHSSWSCNCLWSSSLSSFFYCLWNSLSSFCSLSSLSFNSASLLDLSCSHAIVSPPDLLLSFSVNSSFSSFTLFLLSPIVSIASFLISTPFLRSASALAFAFSASAPNFLSASVYYIWR